MTKEKKRHIRFWKTFRKLLMPIMKIKFNFKFDVFEGINENYIVVSNHNTDYDPILVGLSFPEQMYYVASEHIFRAGILSKLLKRYLAPISRLKGSLATSTVIEMKRSLKQGNNICIFAEGNRSFNGETCEISPAIGKLIKSSNVALVTYKLEGGYLTSPRWSSNLRRGKMKGRIVNVYDSQSISNMTASEINSAINKDLYENAYERQRIEKIKFKGKNLAEGIERALYVCPECGNVSNFVSKGNSFTCSCGSEITYDEYGFLKGTKFDTILDWDKWQKQQIRELYDDPEKDLVLSDENISLSCITLSHDSEMIYQGNMTLYNGVLSFGKTEFELKDILSMAIYLKNNISFTANNVHYEVKGLQNFCARKYLEIYEYILKG